MHAWINRGTTPARMVFVLLDAKPATVAGQPLDAALNGTGNVEK